MNRKRLAKRLRIYYRRTRNFVIFRVLHVDDTPHRIALGVAVGMFVAWTPTPGFQMVLIVAISALVRANKVVGVPLAWLSNPATFWIYLLCYILGCKMLGMRHNEAAFMAAVKEAFRMDHGLIASFDNFFHAMGDVLLPLWVGSLVFSAVAGALTYAATYYGVVAFRRHHARHAAT
jgi:hypothetical protein